jgi:hypothetical protein
MLLDPFSVSKGHRYPDETIVPTALVNLRRSDTYTVGAGGTVGTALHWKLRAATGGVYVGTVAPPGTSFSAGEAAGVVSDYGTAQSSWSALTTVDRTLACGVRVRLVGLPTSTFLPSGTLYFLQIQSLEYTGATFDTEAECIQAVTARRGFSITANELSKMDGAIAPYLPQGPMSFVFSDKDAPGASFSAVFAGAGGGAVSANGAVVVVGFGLQPGSVLRFDYCHHVEYIPSIPSAGLLEVAVEPPSAAARDGMARAAQIVQTNTMGRTDAASLKPFVGSGSTLGSIAAAVGKMAVSAIPGGSMIVKGASAIADTLGAPAWLKSAISSLM